MRISRILAVPFVFAACARGDVSAERTAASEAAVDSAPAPFAAGARDDCSAAGTDSARAVCVAVRAARGAGGIGARVAEVAPLGDGFCVRTMPVDPRAVDGMAMVRVDGQGVLRALVLTDSAGRCADLPPAGDASSRERRE